MDRQFEIEHSGFGHILFILPNSLGLRDKDTYYAITQHVLNS